MKLKELPFEIRQTAELRQFEAKGVVDTNVDLLDAFPWDATTEGVSFWNRIECARIYMDFYALYPRGSHPALPDALRLPCLVKTGWYHKFKKWLKRPVRGIAPNN